MTALKKHLSLLAMIALAVVAYLAGEHRDGSAKARRLVASPAPGNRSGQEAARASSVSETIAKTTIRQRIDNVFPASYMTSLAIIQGVGLGILIAKTQQQWITSFETLERVKVATQALAVLTTITVVTHRYTISAIMDSRMPTFFDILFPYILGVGEIGAAQLIGYDVAWWACVLVFAAGSAGVYLYSRAKRTIFSYEGDSYLYGQFRRTNRRIITATSLLAASSATMIVLSSMNEDPHSLRALAPLVVVFLCISVEVLGRYRITVE